MSALRERLQYLNCLRVPAGLLFVLGCMACDPPPTVDAGAPTDAGTPTTCMPPERPGRAASIGLEPAFPGLNTLTEPLWITQSPLDDGRFYVLEKGGRGLTFTGDGSDAAVFADFSSVVDTTSEAGLLFLAFAPDYATTQDVYITYIVANGARWEWRLSRFTLPPEGPLEMASEESLLALDKQSPSHNGASLAFGIDGFLYVSVGDGGSAADDGRQAQDTNTLLGSILRLDVQGAGIPYDVPPDNPFVGGGGLPEIWAYGFRNPWRMHMDRTRNRLWLGDVGEGVAEEVDIVRRGGNYGWNVTEGDRCFWRFPDCDPSDYELPVATYYHSDGGGSSVTGGFVYRGEAIPSLRGAYVFGDFRSGRIRALVEREGGGFDTRDLLETELAIASFGEDARRELYVVGFVDGRIYRIVPADAEPDPMGFPERLSDLDCMNPLDPTQPGANLIPYSPVAPLWSDGADSERWISLPPDGRIAVQSTGSLAFPIGTVLVKNLRREGRLLETRLLMRHSDGGWGAYTYVWNDTQTDALLAAAAVRITQGSRAWLVPSRTQCSQCHTEAAGRVLGADLAQLDHDFEYPADFRVAGVLNQLDALRLLGVLDEGAAAAPLSAYGDTTRSLEARARSYLHSNCSHCHRPGTPVRIALDMRVGTGLTDTGLCGVAMLDNFDVPDIRIVEPGSPSESVLTLRMQSLDDFRRMPAIGSLEIDMDGVALVEEWITSLDRCP